ncbi:MAG TPA: MauE/DoxX family redox-associated membrane protein [Clostridia bacterium]|nr:MauE/DoxX family redox-associated membrane protein [Clostridia bacterium]
MNSSVDAQPIWRRPGCDFAGVLARWLLGGVFISMGLSKALHPEAFLKLVRQYEMVSQPFLLNSIAATLPWFEVFCGLLLLCGVAVRGSALMLLAMLLPFTGVVLKRALEIAGSQNLPFCAVRFDCGCGNGEVIICHKLAENSFLILLACLLLVGLGQRLSLRFSLFKKDN